MLYEIPLHTKEQLLNWEYGVGNIPAKLPNGMAIDLPVLEATNVLTVGVTGTGKTRSYTLPAARLLLSANPQTKGVFFETKRTFLDAFLEEEDKVISYDPVRSSAQEPLPMVPDQRNPASTGQRSRDAANRRGPIQ